MENMRLNRLAKVSGCFLLSIILAVFAAAAGAAAELNTSGGLNRTPSVDVIGHAENYSVVMYDNSSGLPTSEANAIAETSEGFIWIGSYAGLIRYDGRNFERIDPSSGITSIKCLYVDSRDRLWIGTNDNGIAVMDHGELRMWGKADGMKSVHTRSIAEDQNGTIYVATTCGIAAIDTDGRFFMLEDETISNMNMLIVRKGSDGSMYGLSNFGDIFRLQDGKAVDFVPADRNPMGGCNAYLPDPDHPGQIFFEGKELGFYRAAYGDGITDVQKIDISPLQYVQQMEIIDGKIWICAANGVGVLENDHFTLIENLPMNNNITHVMTDYLGNLWFTSTRQGVMKIVPNRFTNVFKRYDLPDKVVNTTCLSGDRLFVGTDTGLIVIGENGVVPALPLKKAVTASGADLGQSDLIGFLEGCRIRSIIEDSRGRLWISTWRKHGLLRYEDGEVTAFTEEDGLLSDGLRAVAEREDGSILVAVTGGANVIRDDRVIASYGTDDGIVNTESLCVEVGFDGEIVLGTNGDGIYLIDGSGLRRINVEDGLPSDIVLRIKRDTNHNLIWIITSSAIAYMTPDYQVTTVRRFPYPNNFDLYENGRGDVWVLSSNGIYVTPEEELVQNGDIHPVFYGMAGGLPCITTANSYSALDRNGNLYIAGSTGVCKVNIDQTFEGVKDIKAAVPFIEADDETVYPDADGSFTVPARTKKLTIPSFVFDYAMNDPKIRRRLTGFDNESTSVFYSKMAPMIYTNLHGGEYTFDLQVLDEAGKSQKELSVQITKEKKLREMLWFNILSGVLAASLLVLIVTAIVGRRMRRLEQRNRETLRQNMLLQESERKLKAQMDIISSVASIYSSVYELDLERRTFRELGNGDESERVPANGQTDMQQVVNQILRTTVDESCINNELIREVDLSTINERMRYMNVWTKEVLNPKKQWRRSRIIVSGRDSEERITRILWVSEDIDREKREREHLNDVAYVDALTGLSNKAAYDKNTRPIDEAVAAGKAPEFAILMIDLNFLKKVNDTYGHEYGNVYLNNCAGMVSRIYGRNHAYRFGGDEYVVVLTGEDTQKAETLTLLFKQEMAQLRTNPNIKPWEKVSAAIGIARFDPARHHSVEEVFKIADKNMYEDKLAMKAQRTD